MAGEYKIPVVFLNPKNRKLARFIAGLAKRREVLKGFLEYQDFDEAFLLLREFADDFFKKG